VVSNNLLEFASENYGFDKEKLHFIGDNCNAIYAFQKNDKWYILRIGQRPVSFIPQTKAELDWMRYLSENDVNVPLPLLANNGERLIAIQEGDEHYIICAYTAFAGQLGYKHWNKNDPDLWNSNLFYDWGRLTGNMHRLTKDYEPQNSEDVRKHFNHREFENNVKACPSVNKIAEDLLEEINELPKDKDSYGLIHADLHQWNFLIRDGVINVFDFDDAYYGWFALDIGIALYHALWWGRKDDAGTDFTNTIIENFLKGYLSANHLNKFWISKIPMFMKYRQICKFSWFFNPESIDEHQKERIYNIENDILFTGCEIDKSLFDKK
jgi:Ser/Thr protein kinase RdoA (MazF antagonist)